jgi:putative drug exporter of the RND superfamily
MVLYRSPVLALVPLVVVGVAYVTTTGVIYLLNDAFDLPVDTTSRSLLLVLMFGAGTDYCLLVVARYRAALVATDRAPDALRESVPEAAPAILASGFTVVAAMLAMLGAVFGILRTLGPVNAIGVSIVLLASLTLLPALLAILGPITFWPHRSGAHPDEDVTKGVWSRTGRAVRARPAVWLAGSLVLLGVLAVGISAGKTDVNPTRQFRKSADSIAGYKLIRAAFPPGAAAPITVLVERSSGRVTRADLGRVARVIAGTPGVATVLPDGGVSGDRRAATMTLVFSDDPFDGPALRRVSLIRQEVSTLGPGLTVLLGEGSAERADYKAALKRDTKVVVPLVLGLVFVALVVLLESLVAPLFLLATVLLSFAAALGVSLFAFEHVFHTAMDPLVTLVIFIFLIALGADYNIFLMSRVREEALEDSTRDGMLRALVATGPVITSAGVILAGTFSVLTVLPLNHLFEIGFAVGLGILLDTFFVRTLVVPAITWLLGERSWWPSTPRPEERRPLRPPIRRTPA